MDPLQKGLEQSFESERLSRWIRDCQNIEEWRGSTCWMSASDDQPPA